MPRAAVDAPVLNPGGPLDVAVALNWDDFLKFGAELPVDGRTIVIYEAQHRRRARQAAAARRRRRRRSSRCRSPRWRSETAGTDKAKNTVVLGLLAGWFGIGREAHAARASARSSRRRAPRWSKGNERAFAAGLEYAAASTR